MTAKNWAGTPPEPVDPPVKCRGNFIYVRPAVRAIHQHAGTESHSCELPESEHSMCLCWCGMSFTKPFKGTRP
jgi:CDGSH-type Zn-finger protein